MRLFYMGFTGTLSSDWDHVRKFLPFDLDGLARETGALTRCRGFACADDYVRLLLMCGLPGATFERVSDWARETGLGKMNAAALFFRFRDSEAFLQAILSEVLAISAPSVPTFSNMRLLAVDATVLCGPGSKGTDQRVHVVYDLSSWLPISVKLTDACGGEHLKMHDSWGPGDLVLADRGYGYDRGIRSVLDRERAS